MRSLTFDGYGFLDFTQENIDLIETCISVDSRYRRAFDVNHPEGSAWYIKNRLDLDNEESVKELCLLIDRENSTHLESSGTNKGDDKGATKMAERIVGTEDIEKKLERGDLSLVDHLARACEGMYKPSFASKFCTYVSRYKWGLDNYSIYDSVLQNTIPYYAWNYLGERYVATKKSTISIERGRTGSEDEKISCYEDYHALIGRIIERINIVKGLEVNRETFDHMLWYYYKGDETLISSSLLSVRRSEPLFVDSLF